MREEKRRQTLLSKTTVTITATTKPTTIRTKNYWKK
jgi:hypothetical protein